MAAGEVTGATPYEVEQMRVEFEESPLHQRYDVEFEEAYCLVRIGKQPEDYDGPTRRCKNRVARLTEAEWSEQYPDEEYPDYSSHPNVSSKLYHQRCRFHGRSVTGDVTGMEEIRLTVNIKHGLNATDEHLKMDFTDAEQKLYDSIMERWPVAYDWPSEDKDPARYLILDKVAVNVVRSVRAEDYIDENGEIVTIPIFDDQGVQVGDYDEANPLATEYRLLVREINNMLKELGLTPKEQAAYANAESGNAAIETMGKLAAEAIGGEREYDPAKFDESQSEEADDDAN